MMRGAYGITTIAVAVNPSYVAKQLGGVNTLGYLIKSGSASIGILGASVGPGGVVSSGLAHVPSNWLEIKTSGPLFFYNPTNATVTVDAIQYVGEKA